MAEATLYFAKRHYYSVTFFDFCLRRVDGGILCLQGRSVGSFTIKEGLAAGALHINQEKLVYNIYKIVILG